MSDPDFAKTVIEAGAEFSQKVNIFLIVMRVIFTYLPTWLLY